jgi:hypothetical protein
MHRSLLCGHSCRSASSHELISVSAAIPVPGNGLKVSWLIDGKKRLSTTRLDVEERALWGGGLILSNA